MSLGHLLVDGVVSVGLVSLPWYLLPGHSHTLHLLVLLYVVVVGTQRLLFNCQGLSRVERWF